MSKALTPAEKLAKKQRDNLNIIHNRLLSRFNFGEIKCWRDVYVSQGFSPEHIAKTFKAEGLSSALTFPELKAYLQKEKDELEQKLLLPGGIPVAPEKDRKNQEQSNIVVRDSGWEQSGQTGIQVVAEALGEKLEEKPPFVLVPCLQNNDCTVMALSSALKIPYDKARMILTAEGKQDNRGLRQDWLGEFLLGVGFELLPQANVSIREAALLCNSHSCICTTRDHAFAIVNGVIHDWTEPAPNINVKSVWRYTGVKVKRESLKPEVHFFDAKNNYGYVPSPNVDWKKVFLPWHQKKAIAEMKHKVVDEGRRGILLLAGTGTGKTFDAAGFFRWLLDINFAEGRTMSHTPFLHVTKATITEQTGRVFQKFGIGVNTGDVEVTNIEALRASTGKQWLKEVNYHEDGEQKSRWEWRKMLQPCVIALDESQGVKNSGSTQSKIFQAYNDIPLPGTCLVSISATPFTRVSEAKVFAVSTRRPIDHLGFPEGTILTNETWPAYASIIASPAKPDEYNNAAIERLMADLEEYVVRVRGVRPQYDAINGVRIIDFESEAQRKFYNDAWERFLKEQAELKKAEDAGIDTGACRLTILLKFAMAAEFCHASHFARRMYEAATTRKLVKLSDKVQYDTLIAPVFAPKFKGTMIEVVKIFNEKYGVARDKISLIWGGGQTQLTTKQKSKEKIKTKVEQLKALGLSLDEMLEDLGLDDVEDRVLQQLPEHLRLGPQDKRERQREIDKFQAGATDYCGYTLKAGGVGLSLHHSDELTTFKCRRKESGYAVEEDIPKVPVRPRETFCVVSYNAIELVQGVGRVPRLTSLSPTVQNVYCYAGTIEVDMGRIYSSKLRCLSSVVKMHESWQDIMFGSNRARLVEQAISTTANVAEDESSLIEEGDEEEEELVTA